MAIYKQYHEQIYGENQLPCIDVIMDLDSEISSSEILPQNYEVGSFALSCESGKIWIISPSHVWKELTNGE